MKPDVYISAILVALLLFGLGFLEIYLGQAILVLCFLLTGIAVLGWLGIIARELRTKKEN